MLTYFKGICVVKGQTDKFLLNISIANSLTEKLDEIYSVIPGNFFKKVFLLIGPLINFLNLYFFIISKAVLKQFLIYLLDFIEIFQML